jgi:hypothetical protein
LAADHVDVAFDPLQRAVEEVGAGPGRLEKVADHRPRLVHHVRRRQAGLAACITPVAHDHRPVSRTPSPVGTPRPVDARGAGARNGLVANASSWARSSNSASIQLCSA